MSFNEIREKLLATIILGKFVKQAIIKLSLAYSFQNMFFIDQNLKQLLVTYSFLEIFIFFSTLVQIFISHQILHIREILYVNTNSKGNHA